MRVYKDVVEAIKLAKFRVDIPEGYRPTLIVNLAAEDDGSHVPIHNPDPNNRCMSKMPIIYIVDMIHNKIDFRICNPTDTAEIVRLLEMYLKIFAGMNITDTNTKVFIARAMEAYKIMKRYVSARDRAKHLQTPISMVDAIRNLGGGIQ